MKLALRGPEGVAVKLGVVVILGLMLGSGAFALPFSIPFIGRSSAPAALAGGVTVARINRRPGVRARRLCPTCGLIEWSSRPHTGPVHRAIARARRRRIRRR